MKKPQRGDTYQPRVKPWGTRLHKQKSPERAVQDRRALGPNTNEFARTLKFGACLASGRAMLLRVVRRLFYVSPSLAAYDGFKDCLHFV